MASRAGVGRTHAAKETSGTPTKVETRFATVATLRECAGTGWTSLRRLRASNKIMGASSRSIAGAKIIAVGMATLARIVVIM